MNASSKTIYAISALAIVIGLFYIWNSPRYEHPLDPTHHTGNRHTTEDNHDETPHDYGTP